MTPQQFQALQRLLDSVDLLLGAGVTIAGLLVDDGSDEPKLIEQQYEDAEATARGTKEKIRRWRERNGIAPL